MVVMRTRVTVAGIVVVLLLCGSLATEAANKVVFVTSVVGKGNLSLWADAGGAAGLAAADKICQARAAAGGLANPGDFVAWLSDSSNDAYCRVHGFSGQKGNNCGQSSLPVGAGPWIRTDGFPIGDTIQHLLSPEGAVLVPLYLDEFGNGTLYPARAYFTNTGQFGEFNSMYTSCADWTSSASAYVRGGYTVMTTYGWTSGITTSCSEDRHLLCMEKGSGDPIPAYEVFGAQVFVTSVTGSGDLSSWPAAGDEEGIAAGDAICQQLAANAGIPVASSFRAWLSTATGIEAIGAIDRFEYDGPWVRLDGVPVAGSKVDLADGELFTSINLTETGQYVTFYATWTGTVESGTASGATCNDWTMGFTGWFGRTGIANMVSPDWTDWVDTSCDSTVARLYCFGQVAVVFANGFESGDTSAWSNTSGRVPSIPDWKSRQCFTGSRFSPCQG